jgi:cyclopropane-fatty-acyl-phospholipid synthase
MNAMSQAATNQHYDLDARLFRLFLDPTLKYSSGLFVNPEDNLEEAQQRKLDFIANQLALKGGEHILDIGSGWGSLVLHLAGRYDCRVTGVTPAPRQAAFIRERAAALGLADRVEVHVAQICDVPFSSSAFDGITLVGSIVHMPEKARVLSDCYRFLRPHGRLYLSETCFRNETVSQEFAERPGTRFVRDEIFGGGELLPLHHYVRFLENARFSLCGLTDLTAHYYRTIEAWTENALANRSALEAVRPGVTDELLKYFEISNAGWGYTTKQYALVASKSR